MSKATTRVEGFAAADARFGTANGKQVASVRVPHQRRRKDGQGGFENVGPTTWFEATLWEDDAIALEGVRKGDLLVIEGMPEVDVYQGNGEPRVTVRLLFPTVSRVLRGGRSGQGRSQGEAPAGSWAAPAAPAGEGSWGAPAGGYNDGTPF